MATSAATRSLWRAHEEKDRIFNILIAQELEGCGKNSLHNFDIKTREPTSNSFFFKDFYENIQSILIGLLSLFGLSTGALQSAEARLSELNWIC